MQPLVFEFEYSDPIKMIGKLAKYNFVFLDSAQRDGSLSRYSFIAIEPFATNGKGLIYEGGKATIFGLASARPIHSIIARSLLAKIRTFQGLPFSIHDLINHEWPLSAVNSGLDELIKAGVVVGYAPLIEVERGMVAQAENSVLVDEKGKVLITTR